MTTKLNIMAWAVIAGVMTGLMIVAVVTYRNIALRGIDLECGICWALEDIQRWNLAHFTLGWANDGQSIVMGREKSGFVSAINIVDADGTELAAWVAGEPPRPGDIIGSDYSPDVKGSKVAFATLRHVSGTNNKEYEIATANLDGSEYRRLTDEDGSDLAPAWSPDGSRIAFVSNRSGYDSKESKWSFDLYIMDADGSDVRSVVPGLFVSVRLML